MLSKKEFDVLMSVMDNEGISQRAIAEKVGYSTGTVNKIVKDLVEKGYYNGKFVTSKDE